MKRSLPLLSRIAASLSRRDLPSGEDNLRGGASSFDGERQLIAASGLFDASYYLINGADVMAAGAEPLRHFCDHGWRENRRPNLYFDPGWYASRYLGADGGNPLAHYLRRGERDGCRPIAFFDPLWYAAAYRLPTGASALAHYLVHRRSQRFAPNALFDIGFYLARHGAEIGPNRDPFMHHLRNGAAGRDLDPSPGFDAVAYRREAMAGVGVLRTGLAGHEMRVPLVHHLDAQVRRWASGAPDRRQGPDRCS